MNDNLNEIESGFSALNIAKEHALSLTDALNQIFVSLSKIKEREETPQEDAFSWHDLASNGQDLPSNGTILTVITNSGDLSLSLYQDGVFTFLNTNIALDVWMWAYIRIPFMCCHEESEREIGFPCFTEKTMEDIKNDIDIRFLKQPLEEELEI